MAHVGDRENTSQSAVIEPSARKRENPEIRGEPAICVTKLSPTEWRVSSAALADDDPAGLLGFIQRVQTAYEVTNLRLLRERSYFSSFDRAATSLVPRSTSTNSAVSRKVLK